MTSFGGGDTTRTATVVLNADVGNYAQQMNQAAASTGTMSRSVDALQSRMHDLNNWAGRKLFQFSAADFAVLGTATADAAVFQKQLSTLSATAAVTGTSMSSIKNGIESSFSKFPVARSQLVSLTEAITNLGVTAPQQINSLRDTFVKLGAATGEPMNQLAQGLIQLSRQMGVTDATQVGNYANSLLTVSKSAGVSASGVLQFSQSIAPMAKQAGIGESAVLGISTAFSKAGADGFVATNALNTMLQDISQSIATGGPDLLKYSNLLGVTTGQFKEMNKTSAVVDIFKQLTALGPQASQVLSSMGLDGIRSQAAIAAVTQSGGLQQYIQQAEGTQGNQGNLNKGAGAAMSSLADSGERLRNVFTQVGTEIGTTFLTPLAKLADVATTLFSHLNNLLKPFSAIIASLGVFGGALAAIGAVAVNLAGAIGAYALIKTVGRSVPLGAFKAGVTGQRETLAGREPTDDFSKEYNAPGAYMPLHTRLRTTFFGTDEEKKNMRETAMPYRSQFGYRMGSLVGGVAGAAPGEEGAEQTSTMGKLFGRGALGTWRNIGIAGAFRVPGMYARQTAKFLTTSAKTTAQRRADIGAEGGPGIRESWRGFVGSVAGKAPLEVVSQEVPRLTQTTGATVRAEAGVLKNMVGQVFRTGAEFVGPKAIGSLLGGVFTGGMPGAGRAVNNLADRAGGPGAFSASVKSASEAMGGFTKSLGGFVKGTSISFKELNGSVGEAAHSIALLGRQAVTSGLAGAIGGAAKGASALGGLVGKGLGAGASAAGALGSFAFSIPGMLTMFGAERAMSMYRNQQKEVDLNQYLNPIQKYNNMLGTTTQNLANFNTTLLNGTSAAGGIVETLQQAMTVTDQVVKTAPNKPVVSAWNNVKNNPTAQLALLSSMPISDPKQLVAIQQDMAASGMTKSQIQSVMDQYQAAGGPSSKTGIPKSVNFGALGKAIVGTEGKGLNWSLKSIWSDDSSQSKKGSQLAGAALSGIQSRQAANTQSFNAGYANQQALVDYSQLFGPELNNALGSSHQAGAVREALARQMSTVTSGGYGGYLSTLRDDSHGIDLKSDMTPEEQSKSMIKLLQSTSAGKKWLSKVGGKNETFDLSNTKDVNAALVNLLNTSDGSDFNSLLRKSGSLGTFAASNATVQNALGTGSQNFSATTQSTQALQGQALGAVTTQGGAMANIAGLMTSVNTSSPLYAQLQAAQQNILTNQQYQAPFQSRAQQFGTAADNYTQANATYQTALKQGTATPDMKAFVDATQQAYQQAAASANDYFKSTYQEAVQFGNQMARSARDEGIQVANAQKDFKTQQAYANEDFNKQQLRADHDFNLQRSRMNEDFNTQMANNAASAAQSIYDPYLIVQSKYTTDAGQVLQNLTDQNKYISQQSNQLKQLQQMGITSQTIQTLDLANPQNAQELNQLVGDLMNDPQLIAKINAASKTRVGATGALVNNPLNLQFAQTAKAFQLQMTRMITDFDTQQGRADSDFQISMDRAEKAESLAISRMGTAYSNMVKDAQTDMVNANQELSGSFAQMNVKAMAAVTTSIGKYAPAAADEIRTQLAALAKEYPGLGLNTPANATGATYNGQYSNPGDNPNVTPPATGTPHKTALGGIVTSAQTRVTGEAGPEAIIPLNQRGQSFMAGLIAKALAQGITMAYGSQAMGNQSTVIDQSTSFAGAIITVPAQDPNAMARALKQQENLHRLSSPVRH